GWRFINQKLGRGMRRRVAVAGVEIKSEAHGIPLFDSVTGSGRFIPGAQALSRPEPLRRQSRLDNPERGWLAKLRTLHIEDEIPSRRALIPPLDTVGDHRAGRKRIVEVLAPRNWDRKEPKVGEFALVSLCDARNADRTVTDEDVHVETQRSIVTECRAMT